MISCKPDFLIARGLYGWCFIAVWIEGNMTHVGRTRAYQGRYFHPRLRLLYKPGQGHAKGMRRSTLLARIACVSIVCVLYKSLPVVCNRAARGE